MYIMYMLIPTRITHIYMYTSRNKCMHRFLCTYIYMYIYVHTNKQHNQTVFLALSFTHVLSPLFRALNPRPPSPPSCHTQENDTVAHAHRNTSANAGSHANTHTNTNTSKFSFETEQERARASSRTQPILYTAGVMASPGTARRGGGKDKMRGGEGGVSSRVLGRENEKERCLRLRFACVNVCIYQYVYVCIYVGVGVGVGVNVWDVGGLVMHPITR